MQLLLVRIHVERATRSKTASVDVHAPERVLLDVLGAVDERRRVRQAVANAVSADAKLLHGEHVVQLGLAGPFLLFLRD